VSRSSRSSATKLVATLGKDTAKLKFASQPPTVVLMAGLQGSGKPRHRAARQLAERMATPSACWFRLTFIVLRRASNLRLSRRRSSQPLRRRGWRGEYSYRRDWQGSAARGDQLRMRRADRRYGWALHIDDQLMEEMQSLKGLLNPQEILFVADSMTGRTRSLGRRISQEAHAHGRRAHQDGRRCSRRAALSIRQVTDSRSSS